MEFRDASENGLISSQGTPERTERESGARQRKSHGWLFSMKHHKRLEVRRKRHKTGNSSIRFFYQLGRQLFDVTPHRERPIFFLFFSFLLLMARPASSMMPQAKEVDPRNEVQQVGDQFEGMMLQHLYSQMSESNRLLNVDEDNPFAPSSAQRVYESMQQQQVMEKLARTRPLGIGNLVEKQLKGELGISRRPLVKSTLQTKEIKTGQNPGQREL